ncbi:hypothetical protein JCM10213_008182 [Rhodosporidiobolus nylandii]
MPVPSLPLELIELILSHLVSPISLTPPAFYRDLKSAALVCHNWTTLAQKLLWEQVYLSKGDKQVEKWLEVEFKPALAHVSLAYPSIADSKKQFFPSTVKSFAIAPFEPPEDIGPSSLAATIAAQLAEAQKQGHFTLTHLEVHDLMVLRYLADLAPSLRTLVLALQTSPMPVALRHFAYLQPLDVWEDFAAGCSGLTRLVFPVLWDAKLVEAVPPSVRYFKIEHVDADAFPAFCSDFDELSKSWANDVELRIDTEYQHWLPEDKAAVWKQVEESCARRGIRLIVLSGK